MTIAVLDYGMGNLRSVARAIAHVGGEPLVTAEPAVALEADGLVVPGVGHFGACMRNLRDRGLDAVVKEFVAGDRPLFGVCLGMQVLFEGSEEAPDVPGLGVFEGVSRQLAGKGVKVPHMGWNTVRWSTHGANHYGLDAPNTWFYFVHSYAPSAGPDSAGITRYGDQLFASAVSRESVFATQFHPEKSGAWGLALYAAFVSDVAGR